MLHSKELFYRHFASIFYSCPLHGIHYPATRQRVPINLPDASDEGVESPAASAAGMLVDWGMEGEVWEGSGR